MYMYVKLLSGDLNQNNITYDCQKKKKNLVFYFCVINFCYLFCFYVLACI